ncbi:MAG: cation:proton antiporter [Xanthomonadales bacterium]|jgi:Kef-type K+ transport system membrane component KefB|nr:cation:proton antiporter [Xanthomonadales bacterium]
MNTVELFLIAMSLIFGLPWLLWRLGRTDDWAPLVVVQILTGILLGPGLLGAVWPEAYSFVFRPEVIQSLNGIAWWSVMLFVFLAGLELDLAEAWRDRRSSLTTAGLALCVPLLAGTAAGALLLWHSTGWLGAAASPWQFVAGIGMACAVTALPILVLFLEKLGLLHRPLGQRVLRYASLDDLAIWAVLALILLDWNRVGRQVAFLLAFVPAALAFRHLLGRVPARDRWYLALIWLAVISLGADWAGLHYMVGAFLAGAVIDARVYERQALDTLRHHVLLIGMPVFFLSTGLRTQWELGGISVFLAALLLLAAAVGGKLAGVHLAGRWLGWPPGEARLIGWLLQTKALIMIIFANILMDRQVIAADTFTALLLMAVMSTMLTVPMVRPLIGRLRRSDGGRRDE